NDELVNVSPLLDRVGNWREFLLQAEPPPHHAKALRHHERTGPQVHTIANIDEMK
ncbi:MAG: hypothetical protein HY559_00100, partial [Gammaproteobacteria bacterium]|nr:hypothetical protein [Gammaproteobacteria bacterium]